MREQEQLPIEVLRQDYLKALNRPCIVKASTGSGKSTRIPAWLIEEDVSFILVQPRRVVVRSLFDFLNTQFEGAISYQIRFEKKNIYNPRFLIVTPGIFLNYLQDGFPFDPDVILIDEVHERGREIDFILAILKHREFGALTLLSATLDQAHLAQYFDFKVFETIQRQFKIQLEYSEHSLLPTMNGLFEQIHKQLKHNEFRNALVFLPGKSELFQAKDFLKSLPYPVFCMHGNLDIKEQRRILELASPKIILSTNLLESAVTIDGVDLVIDSGLHKNLQFREGREVLSLECVSVASANQRMGRTGRTADGKCIRLWSRKATLKEQTKPEILRSKLTDLRLRSINMDIEPRKLPFLDPPNDYQWDYSDEEVSRYFSKSTSLTRGSEFNLGTEFLSMIKFLKNNGSPESWIDHLLFLCAYREVMGDLSKSLNQSFDDSNLLIPLDLWARRTNQATDLHVLYQNYRSVFGITKNFTITVQERHDLLSALLCFLPEHAYWIQNRENLKLRNDFGRECRLPRSMQHKKLKACFIFGFFEIEGMRRQRMTQADLAIPILDLDAVKLPVTRFQQSKPKLEGSSLLVNREGYFGPYRIFSEQLELSGADLRKAISDHDLMEIFMQGFEDYAYYYDLYMQHKNIDTSLDVEVLLERVGLEVLEDFELLSLNDLFEIEFRLALLNLKQEYPRELREPGGAYKMTYNLLKKEVYFSQRRKGKEPSKLLLSRFRNWDCFLLSAGRCVRL